MRRPTAAATSLGLWTLAGRKLFPEKCRLLSNTVTTLTFPASLWGRLWGGRSLASGLALLGRGRMWSLPHCEGFVESGWKSFHYIVLVICVMLVINKSLKLYWHIKCNLTHGAKTLLNKDVFCCVAIALQQHNTTQHLCEYICVGNSRVDSTSSLCEGWENICMPKELLIVCTYTCVSQSSVQCPVNESKASEWCSLRRP